MTCKQLIENLESFIILICLATLAGHVFLWFFLPWARLKKEKFYAYLGRNFSDHEELARMIQDKKKESENV